jgi:hypothetical protein
MQLAKLSRQRVVAADELLGPQPQCLVPEVIINRRRWLPCLSTVAQWSWTGANWCGAV